MHAGNIEKYYTDLNYHITVDIKCYNFITLSFYTFVFQMFAMKIIILFILFDTYPWRHSWDITRMDG